MKKVRKTELNGGDGWSEIRMLKAAFVVDGRWRHFPLRFQQTETEIIKKGGSEHGEQAHCTYAVFSVRTMPCNK